MPKAYNETSHVWHVFAVRTENRDKFQNYLTDNGIQTIIHYPTPPHKQEAYKEWNNLSYPITEEIHNTIIISITVIFQKRLRMRKKRMPICIWQE